MRSWFPLTDFDFWAFLTSGGIILLAINQSFSLGWLEKESWTAIQIAVALTFAYFVGHAVAEIASRLLEKRLARKIIGSPSEIISTPKEKNKLAKYFLSNSLEPALKELVLKHRHVDDRSDAEIYLRASILARRDPATSSRLSVFQNQYSMCRNVCFACFFAFVLLLTSGIVLHKITDFYWSITALIMAMIMLIRFLKYYKQYSLEIYHHFIGVSE